VTLERRPVMLVKSEFGSRFIRNRVKEYENMAAAIKLKLFQYKREREQRKFIGWCKMIGEPENVKERKPYFIESGERFKAIEKEYEDVGKLDKNLFTVFRFDGKSFSKFTKAFKKNTAYDICISDALILTARKIMDEYHFHMGFCASDEITMVWKPASGELQTLMFQGRVQKLISVLSSKVSVVFYQNLIDKIRETYSGSDLAQHVSNSFPIFDGRVFQVKDFESVKENIRWRVYETKRNSIAMLAQHNFSHKKLHGLKTSDMLKLLEENEIDWNKEHDEHKYGTTFVRKRQLKETTNEKTGKTEMCERGIVLEQCLDLNHSRWNEIAKEI
jgi:tRNA(His) guanylyltransferase